VSVGHDVTGVAVERGASEHVEPIQIIEIHDSPLAIREGSVERSGDYGAGFVKGGKARVCTGPGSTSELPYTIGMAMMRATRCGHPWRHGTSRDAMNASSITAAAVRIVSVVRTRCHRTRSSVDNGGAGCERRGV